MITRERLEELIEQKAKIYSTHWKEEVDLSLPCEIEYDGVGREFLLVQEDKDHRPSYWLQNLTEDVETAKWEEEFGCIERTEKLELPTWGKSKIDLYIEWFDNVEFKYFIHDDTYCLSKGCEIVLELEATKENYTLACRKAKELFLGEQNGH